MKFTVANTIAILVAIIAAPVGPICLKLAAEGWVNGVPVFPLREFLAVNGLPVTYFVTTLLVGILHPLGVTIALRDNTPNIVFATVGAPSVILVHLSLAWYFKYPLSFGQWVAIGIIVFGTLLLRSPAGDPADDVTTDAMLHEFEEEPLPGDR